MSESEKTSSDTSLNEQKGASPLPGCIIVIVTMLVFGGLAVLYIGVGYWMNSQLDAITAPTPVEISVAKPSQQQIDSAYHKLEQIKQASETQAMVRIAFTAEDINALIASEALLTDLRGKAFVEKIDSQGIQTKVTQQLRSLPLRPDRFLNATIAFVPVVLRDSLVFEIHDVRVPGKEVPQGFIEGYSKQDFFKLDAKNEQLKPILLQLRRAYLEDDHVIIETGRDKN
ncbi:MAG: LmeA family phospholipid-binding protein [Verrucomicrobiota bacterium]